MAGSTPDTPRLRVRCRGFTFVGVLVMLVIMMLGAAVAGPLWRDQNRRERELELLRIGALYARAIDSYRAMSPGSLKEYPQTLAQLTLDPRFVGMVRHLRALYPDPVARGMALEPVLDERGRIIGVHSRSIDAPIASGPVDLGDIQLPAAVRYSDWKFLAAAVSSVKTNTTP